jgi:hypothetical protein
MQSPAHENLVIELTLKPQIRSFKSCPCYSYVIVRQFVSGPQFFPIALHFAARDQSHYFSPTLLWLSSGTKLLDMLAGLLLRSKVRNFATFDSKKRRPSSE